MTNLEKLVEKFVKQPHRVNFGEVQSLLEAFGYKLRKTSGGH